MGTDGEHTYPLTSSGHTDGVLDSDQERLDHISDLEIQREAHVEEARSLTSSGGLARKVTGRTCACRCSCLCFLPILTFIWIFMAFIICYSIAVSKDHVEAGFPYISHTAVDVPERGIFTLLVFLGAIMLAANMCVKYLEVEAQALIWTSHHPHDRCINIASLAVGLISAFGLAMVASFQTREMREVHYTGAFLAFVGGMAYCWMQTSLSIRHRLRSIATYFQIINSVLLTVFLFIFGISKIVYKNREAAGHGTKNDNLRDVYLLSTVSEWLTALFSVSYVLTYCRDFYNGHFNFPSFSIRNEQVHNHPSSSGQNGEAVV